jgi:hypothetical protein
MAGNGTKQTLAEARARLEAALERNPDSIADAHERLVDVAKASRALLAALKAAEVGKADLCRGYFYDTETGHSLRLEKFRPVEAKRGTLYFAEDEA